MYRFTLSAFADEIDPSLQKQIEVLKRNDVSYIELRSIDGKNISDFSNDYAREVKKHMEDGGIGVSAIGSPIGKIHFGDDFDAHFDKFKHVAELAELFVCSAFTRLRAKTLCLIAKKLFPICRKW